MSAARRALGALLAVAAALSPSAAAAESPKWGTFELRVATYRPDIDSEFGGAATPYADVFGKDRDLFTKALVSWTLLDRYVQIDAGVGSGWFRARAKGLFDDGTPSDDTTTFSIIPATAALTIRFDGLADLWSIPVEFYGRAALERYHWFITDGAGTVVEKGATNGWSVAGGVGFLLDFLDPVLAREFDNDSGVNRTWLFVEVEKGTVDDFGSNRSWILSDEELSLAAGLRLVF